MHPEIMRALTAQHGRELQERAHRVTLARTARRTLRALRHGTRRVEADEYAGPAIPDYVDGSFRTAGDGAASGVPSDVQGRVPAARRAA
jgi:hypothetical protein